MKYISFIFITLIFFTISCNSDNTVKPTWKGCITDKNCENSQKCVAGNCIETNKCEKDENCLNGQFCNKNKLCETYCKSDDDCGSGFICNIESKKCIKNPDITTCEKDLDCEAGEICKDYECIKKEVPKACDSDLNCLNGQHCSNNICIKNCDETSCKEGYQCNSETKECELSKCEKDLDCKEGFYCENQICKTKKYDCTEDSDCFIGYQCKENICQLINENYCDTINDCDGELTIKCLDAHWECLGNECVQKCGPASCQVADDCQGTPYIDCLGAHWECKDNICIGECGGEKCGNGVCDNEIGEDYKNCPQDCRDDHCDDGSEPICDMMPPNCNDGQILAYYNNCYACVDPDTCKPTPEICRTDDECGDGFICTENGTCKKIECSNDTDCNTGNLCIIGACNRGVCNTMAIRCPQDMTCNPDTGQCEGERPYCGNGECEIGEWDSCPEDCQQPDCQTDMDCADGEYCSRDGECKPNDLRCQTDTDCNDGEICVNGECNPDICIPGMIECPEGFTCENNSCIANETTCGNRICESGENYDNCPEDCGVTPICEPDQFEPNNTRRNARNIILENYHANYNLTLCDNDTDWFTLRIDTYTELSVNTNQGFKTELYLRGSQAAIATSSSSSDGKETLVYDNNDPNSRSTNIILKVFRNDTTTNNTSTNYNLDIQLY